MCTIGEDLAHGIAVDLVGLDVVGLCLDFGFGVFEFDLECVSFASASIGFRSGLLEFGLLIV